MAAAAASTSGAGATTIPRVIHQMWLYRGTGKECAGKPPSLLPGKPTISASTQNTQTAPPLPPPPLPEAYASKYRDKLDSWAVHNPDYRYCFWTNADVQRMWEQEPALAPWRDFALNGLRRHIEFCDFSRYALLYLYGGIYADLKVKCLRPLDPLLTAGGGRSLLMAYEPEEHSREGHRRISNSILGSVAGHPFWPAYMSHIASTYRELHDEKNKSAHYTTGPSQLDTFVHEVLRRRRGDPELIVPSCLLFPRTWTGDYSNEYRRLLKSGVVAQKESQGGSKKEKENENENDGSSSALVQLFQAGGPFFDQNWLKDSTGWYFAEFWDTHWQTILWAVLAIVLVAVLAAAGAMAWLFWPRSPRITTTA